jgi:hypothetical protein
MTKRGNSVLGSGCYAAALSSTVDGNKVIKVGNNVADPWLDYYTIIKENANNPCVPRTYSLYLDEQHNYYVCVMERLSDIGDNSLARKAVDLCKEFTESWHTDEQFLELAAEYNKQIPYPTHMLSLLKQIRELTECFRSDYSEESSGRMLDMHHGNFLLRDDAIIVTDPWCESDMRDIDDVNDWASRHSVG